MDVYDARVSSARRCSSVWGRTSTMVFARRPRAPRSAADSREPTPTTGATSASRRAPPLRSYLNVPNANVSANVILAASTLYDSGYKDLDQMGGFSQAYVTLKAPNLFGNAGGIAWTVGSFSNRYGTAGPEPKQLGLLRDLSVRAHARVGRSAHRGHRFEPRRRAHPRARDRSQARGRPLHPISKNPPIAPYLPDQQPVPQGSNYVHHAHAALVINDTLRIAGHYMTSWTPNDFADQISDPDVPGRLTVMGGEVHIDGPVIGSGYVGYSHIKADDIMPLADGIQVLHGANGYGFKQNYFGALNLQSLKPRNDSGTVDSVLGQYILHFAPLVGGITKGPDATLAVYGMLNHVNAPTFTTDKMKFGTELQVSPIRYFSVGGRFDRVLPDGSNNTTVAYEAVSPRVIVHTNYLSREYVVIDYTHYYHGSKAYRPRLTTREVAPPDIDLFTITALVSF